MVSTREETSRKLILFRCDANERIGFGHVARCLAWAEALADEGTHVEFAGEYSEDAKALIDAAGISCRSPSEAAALEWNAVVLDGYHFADDEMFCAFERPCGRIWVDDFGDRRTYLCNAIVNFTVGARRLAYPGAVKDRYLGPQYFPARRSLRTLRASCVDCATPRRVLVAIGGFDRGNFTARACEAIAELDPGLAVTAALGSRFAWKESLAALKNPVTLLGFQSAVASMFRGADLCICGGGLIKYECAYLGIPAAVISQTPQQHNETLAFGAEGLAFNLGYGPELTSDLLRQNLARFLEDCDLRDRIAQTGLRTIPEDAPRRLARALIASFA